MSVLRAGYISFPCQAIGYTDESSAAIIVSRINTTKTEFLRSLLIVSAFNLSGKEVKDFVNKKPYTLVY